MFYHCNNAVDWDIQFIRVINGEEFLNKTLLMELNICFTFLPNQLKPFTNYPLIYNSISDPDKNTRCPINPLSILIPAISPVSHGLISRCY